MALSALDMVRRLAQKQPVDRARMFKANSDFDWNAPLKKRRSSKYAAPIAVLAVLLVALAVACWYFFTHFSLGGGNGAGGALPVSGSTSISTSASSGAVSYTHLYPDVDAARCNGMIFGRGGALRRQYADDGGLWSFPHRPLFFLSFRCLALCLVV